MCLSVPAVPRLPGGGVAAETAAADVGHEDQPNRRLLRQVGLREGPMEIERGRVQPGLGTYHL